MTKWSFVHKPVRQCQATGNRSLLHSFLIEGNSASYPFLPTSWLAQTACVCSGPSFLNVILRQVIE